MYAFFQVSEDDNSRSVSGDEGHNWHYMSKSNETNIEFLTSQWKYNNKGFNLTWRGKCKLKIKLQLSSI